MEAVSFPHMRRSFPEKDHAVKWSFIESHTSKYPMVGPLIRFLNCRTGNENYALVIGLWKQIWKQTLHA